MHFKDLIFLSFLIVVSSCREQDVSIPLRNNSKILFSDEGKNFTTEIVSGNGAVLSEVYPIRIEIFGDGDTKKLYFNYTSVADEGGIITARSEFVCDDVKIEIIDVWSSIDGVTSIQRKLHVVGESHKAFLSAIEFEFNNCKRKDIDYFVPGMIYGSTENLTPNAIGGENVYRKGEGKVWIREDRLPVPMMAFRFKNGVSFTLMDTKPDGNTTFEDAHDVEVKTIIDEALRFGSLFAEQNGDMLKTGYAFPGTEGEYTYKGNTYPGGQIHKWRKRYHPLKDGLEQEYMVSFSLNNYSDFQSFYSSEWQKAYDILAPEVNHQNIELVRNTILSIIPDLVIVESGKVGLSNWYDATDSTDKLIDDKAIFGFTGKNLEMAYYLLFNSDNNSEYKKLACQIINSFLDLKVNPPIGEGYYFKTGKPALAIPAHNCIYLRSYGDGMKVLAKAYFYEKKNGTDHEEWLSWMNKFGIWVLTQQHDDGGFPRSWESGTGKVLSASPASSYNIIPFLCEMYEISGDNKWLVAALKAGEFSWSSGQNAGRFVGGTIDNPDVLDKEAGTLSLEAYLALFEATRNMKWLKRAEVAAQYAETWIYLWNVPMVKADAIKEWDDNVSTVGVQLISTGHSLVDNYMAFDVDEYVKLYSFTGKKQYLDVAKILLHNTKGMLALPNRLYQYRAPGWIQEHWSMAPPRGKGLHSGWLPWVTTSNLNGICETESFDEVLFDKLN